MATVIVNGVSDLKFALQVSQPSTTILFTETPAVIVTDVGAVADAIGTVKFCDTITAGVSVNSIVVDGCETCSQNFKSETPLTITVATA